MDLPQNIEALNWKPRTEDPRDGFIAHVTLWGVNFHAEARPVREGPRGEQLAIAPYGVNCELDSLAEFAAADGPFETVQVRDFDCVVTLVPFCD